MKKSGHWFSGGSSRGLAAHVTGIALVILVGAFPVRGEEVKGVAAGALPVLRDNCFSCHNAEKLKGGLLLTSREGVLKGGESGPAIVPDKPLESRVIQYLAPDADPHMPPKKQLGEGEIAALRNWVEAGAPWDEAALVVKADEKPVQLRALPAGYKPVMALALSPDDRRLAVGRGNRIVAYDLSDKARPVAWQREIGPDVVCSVAISPDGKHVAAGTYRQLVVCDAQAGTVVRELKGLADRVTAVGFTDRDTIAFADGAPGQAGRVSSWSFATSSSPEGAPPTHNDSVLALSAGGDSTLITAGADKSVRVWDAKTRQEKTRLEGHPGHVLALAIKKDNSVLASGGAGGEIRVWDLKTYERKNIIAGHPAAVTALAFSPDGKTIYSACEDGAVRASREDRNQPDKTFPPAGDMIYCLAITSDGKTLFGGCHDGAVYVWDSAGKLEGKLE